MGISERVKNYRKKGGLSQEQLAQDSELNLRTIQRIESGETIPRGDSLRRIAVALKTSPDELIDWTIAEDKNLLTVLSLSQLSFVVFPILGILIPLIIWILKKEKISRLDQLGKSIINFQISWTLVFFSLTTALTLITILHLDIGISVTSILPVVAIMYSYNILLIVLNTILLMKDKALFYRPSTNFLR